MQLCPNIDVSLITGTIPYNILPTFINIYLKLLGYKDNETLSWDTIVARTILWDEEHVAKAIRGVIHYMETVPMLQRSQILTDQFFKQCASKILDLVPRKECFKF